MNWFTYLVIIVLTSPLLLPAVSVSAPALPQVPITYPGDTNETIIRRAQWIEGAKKEETLVWWGTRGPDDARKITAEFNKVYPFIKVNYWRSSSGEIAAKLEAEYASGRFTADIVLGGEAYNVPRWREMGMLEKFTNIIPDIQKMDMRTYSKYRDWAIPGGTVSVPTYNTKLVPAAEAPKKWEDLLDPKWKGQIGLTADARFWPILAVEDGGWGVKKTEQFLTKLREQKLIWGKASPATHSLLQAGEFKINALGMLHHVIQSQGKGAPVDRLRVNPVMVSGAKVTLRMKAPHPHAARLFVEWLFSRQGLLAFTEASGQYSLYLGSETRAGKFMEGLTLVIETEEGLLKAIDLDLYKRFDKILGITE